jgi:competence protein ComEA
MVKSIRKLVLLLITVALIGISPLAAGTGKININTANEKELVLLKRVGPRYAARIVQYRNEVGAFEKPEDIMKVQGIGRMTFEANADVIIVKDEAETVAKSN